MRIIEFEKTYNDGHSIRLEFQAVNMAIAYVDDNYTNGQHYFESKSYEEYIDNLYRNNFEGDINNWTSKTITYKEYDVNSEILWGTKIREVELSSGSISYECEHAGRKIIHDGMINHINREKALFDEWKKEWQHK